MVELRASGEPALVNRRRNLEKKPDHVSDNVVCDPNGTSTMRAKGNKENASFGQI